MRRTKIISALAVTGVLIVGVLGLTTNAVRANKIERVDFDKIVTATTPVYDASLPDVSDAGIKEFRIPIKNATIEIADGVKYQGWTFGGTVPGPVIHVRQGDRVRINVVNEADMLHRSRPTSRTG